ncbi:MAG: SMP-30/gluconolactonase/LRE family protein [Microvirga sp.]
MTPPGETFRDPILVLDDGFRKLVNATARLERVATGFRWVEGPAYFPASRYLIWSDIPNDRIMRYDEVSGAVHVFRQPSHFSNGNTVDRQGRLITCEHGARRVTRTEHDGSITVLASHHEGKRLNSPNDAVVRSDGSVWFTDPAYGIDSDYEGHKAESEVGGCHVYRIDPQSGGLTVVADDFVRPNGIAFSLDESKLYVADTGATHVADGPRHIRVFDVSEAGVLSGGSIFATCYNGLFDGFRLDEDGRIWTSAGDGVHCYSPAGALIGKVLVPEIVANVVFGGPRRNQLYICATTSIYSILLYVKGARTF